MSPTNARKCENMHNNLNCCANHDISIYLIGISNYTRKNACSVTAFDSTDIRSVQDNVATPVTAMMVTVCISIDALSSVFISPDLSDTNTFHQCCWSIMPVTVCSYRLQQSVPNIPVSFCYIRLIQP